MKYVVGWRPPTRTVFCVNSLVLYNAASAVNSGSCFTQDGNSKEWAGAYGAGNTDCEFSHGACMKKGGACIALCSYFVTHRRAGLVGAGVPDFAVMLRAVLCLS